MHGVEKSRALAREARKMHFFTPRRVFAHAHYKLEFDDAERLLGRSDEKFSHYVHILKMRSKYSCVGSGTQYILPLKTRHIMVYVTYQPACLFNRPG